MRALGRPHLCGVELFVENIDGSPFTEVKRESLRRDLLALAESHAIDIAVQKDDIFRKSKRMLCMDVDSTFVKGEFIDELAELAGVKPQVAEITARAMRGELDFKAALRERVKLLAGLPMERAMTLCERYELSPGAEDLVCAARRLGLKVGLVSGGFSFFVAILEKKYELDFTFANELEVVDGKLTGQVLGTIVDAERKEQVLRDMAHVYGITLEQTIAAGDGANDISMLKAAGLGVAYQAKPKLKEVADAVLTHHDRLDSILYFLGLDAREVRRSCRT
jgi:phosphoserine phosphatase